MVFSDSYRHILQKKCGIRLVDSVYNGNSTDTITSAIQETSSGVLSLTKGELELNNRTRINYGSIYTIENICAYNSNTSAGKGAIKIKLPFSFVSMMFYAEIYIYNA